MGTGSIMERRARRKDRLGEGRGKQGKGELSILDDPRNYGPLPDDDDIPDIPMLDDDIPPVPDLIPDEELPQSLARPPGLSESITAHRLADSGRSLEYRLATSSSQHHTSRWARATALQGPAWSAKMRGYWTQRPRAKRRREAIERDYGPEAVCWPRLGCGRRVYRCVVERDRELWFCTLPDLDSERGKLRWVYGRDMGKGWERAVREWRGKVRAWEGWEEVGEMVGVLRFDAGQWMWEQEERRGWGVEGWTRRFKGMLDEVMAGGKGNGRQEREDGVVAGSVPAAELECEGEGESGQEDGELDEMIAALAREVGDRTSRLGDGEDVEMDE